MRNVFVLLMVVACLGFPNLVYAEEKIEINGWRVDIEESPLGDRTHISAMLRDSGEKMSLVLRCKDEKTNVYLAPHKAAFITIDNKKAILTYKLDEQEIKAIDMDWGQHGQAAFFSQPINFAREVSEVRRLGVRLDLGGNIHEGLFDLTGLNEIIPKIEKFCKWPAPRKE